MSEEERKLLGRLLGDGRVGWRLLPSSPNIDDRRGQSVPLTASAPLSADARESHGGKPPAPASPYNGDIDETLRLIQFESELRRMERINEARAANEAWLRSIEK